MNENVSRLFAQGYLSGFFGTVGLMLSNSPTSDITAVTALDNVETLATKYSVLMHGNVKGGGVIGVLLSANTVYQIKAAFAEEEATPKESIDDADLPSLHETFEPCVGGGASYFKEAYSNVVALESIEVQACSAATLGAVSKAMGAGVAADFTFTVSDSIQGEGTLVFSEQLEETIPASATEPDRALGKDEVNDILGDFSQSEGDQEPEGAPTAPAGAANADIGNLARILDINLTATARLGRVEMPIAEILALGPGSIIEVGHVVDEPVELLVNEKLIARGDVVVVDEKFGLRITEIISPQERIENLS